MGIIGKLSCIDGEFKCIDARRALAAGTEGGPSCMDGIGAPVAGDVIDPSSVAGL